MSGFIFPPPCAGTGDSSDRLNAEAAQTSVILRTDEASAGTKRIPAGRQLHDSVQHKQLARARDMGHLAAVGEDDGFGLGCKALQAAEQYVEIADAGACIVVAEAEEEIRHDDIRRRRRGRRWPCAAC